MKTTPLLVLTAVLADFAGGVASRFLFTDELFTDELRTIHFGHSGPLRASRFDLVNEKGQTLASLAQDGEFSAALVFFDPERHQPRAAFGTLRGPYAPVLDFRGIDGKSRILNMLHGADDEPLILFRDARGGSRYVSIDPSRNPPAY